VRWEIRPLGHWTDRETPGRQSSSVFRATWDATLELLAYETEHLGADLVVIQVDVDRADLRRDGMLRTRAHVGHPGAVVSFASDHGPLRYASDQDEQRWSGSLPSWQANVRAIALALEALRAVDRYGVSRRGEQYRGWTALTAGSGAALFGTRADAETWLRKCADQAAIGTWADWESLYKALAKRMHPDAEGGSADLWERLDAAATLLGIRRGNSA
jgi:hypothetical protein